MPSEGHLGVEILALDGIPEVGAGDDLARLIGDAIDRTPGLLPLGPADVLVVTQKVVSKAEGAVVDLETVNPRPEAVEFARRFDRDPRQVEVVLREARRIVRMDRGVLITETSHGFVCANGVSGLLALEDLRGVPDHDGRVMRSTVRAVADELASAAELAFGKTSGRPVALARGAAFRRGEGSIRDLVMPAENDLFR